MALSLLVDRKTIIEKILYGDAVQIQSHIFYQNKKLLNSDLPIIEFNPEKAKQILSEAGWKDTVRANPQEITRVIARFEDYTGKFAYHCHVLEHEDHEMMRQFQVVPPCPADLTGDGVINASDLALLLGAWGPNTGHPADLTDDGQVNASDLALLLGAWGLCPLE